MIYNSSMKKYKKIEDMILALTENFAESAKQNIKQKGFFSIALSGGNTPKLLFANIAKLDLEWDKIFFFMGDERLLPLTSEDSNYYHAEKLLFSQIDIPQENIFPVTCSAEEYEIKIKTITNFRFDLIYLGMGDDGHTASLFPNTEGLNEETKMVIKVPPPTTAKPAVPRITITYPLIKKAKKIEVFLTGKSKIDLLNSLKGKEKSPNYPISEIIDLKQAEFHVTE